MLLLRLKGKKLLNASTALAATGFLLFGYDQGVMSGIVTNDDFLRLMGDPEPAMLGALVSLYEIGCLVGALMTGTISDRYGRKATIRIGCSILLVGAILQTVTNGFALSISSRIITGIGNGMNTATVPVFQSEISPPQSRGAHVCFECCLLVVGIGMAYWLEFGLYYVDGDIAWRFPLAFQAFFGVILLAGTFILPETPRWLVAHGHHQGAKQVLADLWTDGNIKAERCLAEFNEIKEAIEYEQAATQHAASSYRALFNQTNRSRVCLGMLTQMIQQLSGINVTTYYLANVFLQAGLSRAMAMMLAGIDSIVYFIGSLLPIYLTERVGRRKIMLWGLVGQMITLVCIGGCQKAGIDYNQGTWTAAGGSQGAVVMTMMYNFVFGASWLGMAWLYPAEIFSTGLRAKGNSLSTAANWLGNFVVAEMAPIMFDSMGYWTYVFFAGLNLLFIPLVYFLYPETQGLSLEQIEQLFTATTHHPASSPTYKASNITNTDEEKSF